MGRDVDERKKRAALRKLRKAAQLAEQGLGPPLSDWEQQFLQEVEERIETYGSAFADPLKGEEGEALSSLQRVKLKEIDKKARGKARRGFSQKKGGFGKRPAPRVRQLDEDVEPSDGPPPRPPRHRPEIVRASGLSARTGAELPTEPPEPSGRPAFRVIEGGKKTE